MKSDTVATAATTKADPSAAMIGAMNREYDQALARARQLQQMTDTAAWQAQYAYIQKQAKETRERFALRLGLLEKTAAYGWSDADRKELKDIAKESEALEVAHENVMARMILPLRNVVDECRHILDHYTTKAKDTAAREPMFAGQILSEMETAVASVPKVQWLEESGCVAITE